MLKGKRIYVKIASLLMCVTVVGSSVSFVPVFASETKMQADTISTTKVHADNNTGNIVIRAGNLFTEKQSVVFGLPVMEDGIAVLYDDEPEAVDIETGATVEEFISQILEAAGISIKTEDLRLDWVDEEGFRTRVLTGEDETVEEDAATKSIQTAADLYALAEEQENGFTLVVFDDEHEIMRWIVTLSEASNTLKVDSVKETLDNTYSVRYHANGGVLDNENIVVRADGEAISYIETIATYEGHIFDGWYDAEEGGNEVTESTIVTSDMVVYAHWKQETADETDDGSVDTTDSIPIKEIGSGTENPTENATKMPESTDTESDDTSETVQKYTLTVISSAGTTSEVIVNDNVQLSVLADKLGYDVDAFSLKTATVTEHRIDGTTTMKTIADLAESGDVLIIGYDSDGKALGSAQVTKTADNTFRVTMSKDTNVDLGGSSDKGKGENGKGEGEVSNTGKGDAVASKVQTSDTSILPIYGSMGGMMAVLSVLLGVLKKRRLG